jgi:hypothetical protein
MMLLVLISGHVYVLTTETLAVEIEAGSCSGAAIMLQPGSQCVLVNQEAFSGRLATVQCNGTTYLLPSRALEAPQRRSKTGNGRLQRAS